MIVIAGWVYSVVTPCPFRIGVHAYYVPALYFVCIFHLASLFYASCMYLLCIFYASSVYLPCIFCSMHLLSSLAYRLSHLSSMPLSSCLYLLCPYLLCPYLPHLHLHLSPLHFSSASPPLPHSPSSSLLLRRSSPLSVSASPFRTSPLALAVACSGLSYRI